MHILDHLGLHVSDLERSRAFYVAALAPLGITLLRQHGGHLGFGRDKPDLWISVAPRPPSPVHVALLARSREEVDAFHAAALAAGAKDNGAPGPRPQYHGNYYGAFVLDPDGHNVEAVHHG
jgi:catechol 2,3-dioxygenase-like lactoylglutathione lyase family enzyme